MSSSQPTLFDILLGVFDELGQLVNGVATGGSATTLVDSGLAGRDGDWKLGTLFITKASSAAPEGEFAEVTAYARTAGTVTVASSALTAAPASGDEYALASKRWTLSDLKRIVNRALVRMGDIPTVDTSLTTAAGQTEYTLPAGARRGNNLRRVYMDRFGDSDDTLPEELTHWRPEGSSLMFRNQLETGRTLTLIYMAPHGTMSAYGDALSPYVHLNRIVAEAAFLAMQTGVRRTEGIDRSSVRDFNALVSDLELARKRFPIMDPGTPFKSILVGKKEGLRRSKYGPWLQE